MAVNQRTILRWIHIVFSIPIVGYFLSPVEKIPACSPPTRYVFFPLMAFTELWMWRGHVVRRLFAR